MANESLADFVLFRNQQIEVQTQLEEYLEDVKTLLSIPSIIPSFYELPKSSLHRYFSITTNLIKRAVHINQTHLDYLLQQRR